MKNKIIGHRGAIEYFPENTLESFQKAIELGVFGIELDVHLSADQEIIVIHDETLERTTNGFGFVKNYSLSEIKQLAIEDQFKIPTLTEVFDLVNRKCLINIEIKSLEATENVYELIADYVNSKNWMYSDFLISSFHWSALQKIQKLNSKIPLGVLTAETIEDSIAFAETIQAKIILPHFKLLTEENTAEMQVRNLKVFAWTVNLEADIELIKSYRVDAIITDNPENI